MAYKGKRSKQNTYLVPEHFEGKRSKQNICRVPELVEGKRMITSPTSPPSHSEWAEKFNWINQIEFRIRPGATLSALCSNIYNK